MYIPHFVYPSSDGLWGGFHHLSLVTNAAVKTAVQVSESLLSVLLDVFLLVELLDHMVIIFFSFILEKLPNCSAWQLCHFMFPPAAFEIFLIISVISTLISGSVVMRDKQIFKNKLESYDRILLLCRSMELPSSFMNLILGNF